MGGRAWRTVTLGVLAWLLLGPAGRAPGLLPGYANVDAWDTVQLRGLVQWSLARGEWPGHSTAVYWPAGFDVGGLLPNRLDHLLAAPFVALLPFPLADTLFWWAVLLAAGLAGHTLGRAAGGRSSAGWAGALVLMGSEALLREANLGHAPQGLVAFGAWALAAALRLRASPGPRQAGALGVALALCGLAYWYFGLFMLVAVAPLLWGRPLRRLGTVALVLGAAWVPALGAWLHTGQALIAATPTPEVPAAWAALGPALGFVAMHGSTLDLVWATTPWDTSNRLGLGLLVAAALGARRTRDRRVRWALVGGSALAAVMVLGPVLRGPEGPVSVGGAVVWLPFEALRSVHPFFARLTWPERWGLVLPLLLGALAARAPRPALWGLLVLGETLLRSGNAPLAAQDAGGSACLAAVAPGPGAALVLPLRRGALGAARVGFQQRHLRRPLVNPLGLPPGLGAPPAWLQWLQSDPGMAFLRAVADGAAPPPPGAAARASLAEQGLDLLVVDADPAGPLTEGGLNRYRATVGAWLGPPVDLGCALVWAVRPGVALPPAHPAAREWRRVRAAGLPAPAPLPTLIEPLFQAANAGDSR